MGAICSCFRSGNEEEYVNPNSSRPSHCVCLSFVLQNIRHVCTLLIRRGELHSLPSSLHGTASVTPTSSLDDSLPDTYRSPPRPLPYDADPRCYRLQRERLASRREKGSSHLHEEAEPLRNDDTDAEQSSVCEKVNVSACDAGSKWHISMPLKPSSVKEVIGCESIYSSSEDEDICPTCLEEYTLENPKIETKCSHHFHLGCIYEWMERSPSCPVCGQVMEFDETV